MPLECDDFVFRKVNRPLLLRRGARVGSFQVSGQIVAKGDES